MKQELNHPTLIAAWPGMGHVALTACYYLISKLQMEFRAEYASSELFDVDHVSIEDGLVQAFRYPLNQCFGWKSPDGEHDLLVFIGEAQPSIGRYDFCRKLIDHVQREGISRVVTFAAMATNIDLESNSRVVGAATDSETLHAMLKQNVNVLRNGSISGMNGILLGVAAERKIPGGCLLGEMPHTLVNVPYPKASHAVLEVFARLTGMEIDLDELKLEVTRVDKHLTDALDQFRRLGQQAADFNHPEEEAMFLPDPADNGKLSADELKGLETLFDEAGQDLSKAYELKRELDRLNVFREYEDRFLDLFKKPE